MSAILETPDQRTADWFQARLGHATASRFIDVMAVLKSGKPAQARTQYALELVTERLTGNVTPKYVSAAMQWGTDHEFPARELFKARSGLMVEEVGFMRHPEIAAGASPDGLVPWDETIEIKCPYNSTRHLETWLYGMPADHIPQVQGQLWITGRQACHFVSYDPRFPEGLQLYVERIERDDAFITTLEREVRAFLAEVDTLERTLRERTK